MGLCLMGSTSGPMRLNLSQFTGLGAMCTFKFSNLNVTHSRTQASLIVNWKKCNLDSFHFHVFDDPGLEMLSEAVSVSVCVLIIFENVGFIMVSQFSDVSISSLIYGVPWDCFGLTSWCLLKSLWILGLFWKVLRTRRIFDECWRRETAEEPDWGNMPSAR